MKDIKLPKEAVLTGLSALIFHGIVDHSNIKKTITMKRGTNPSSYSKEFVVLTESINTMMIGIDRTSSINVYLIERLYIQLDKFNLEDDIYILALERLEDRINIGILRELVFRLKGKIRGVSWGRVENFAFGSKDSKNKYMTKRKLLNGMMSEFVYTTYKIELNTITFIDTQKVIDKVSTDLEAGDVQKIGALKNAFEFLVSHKESFSLDFFKSLNRYVASSEISNAGSFRVSQVTISNTSYIPPIPTEESIAMFFKGIFEIQDPRDRAATCIAKSMKLQLFNDGNKRTAILAGNKILIDSETGLISIPNEYTYVFMKLIKEYYEHDYALGELLSFLKLCIFDTHEEKIRNIESLKNRYPKK